MTRQVDQEDLRAMVEDEHLSDEEIGVRIGLSRESAARLRRRRGLSRESRPIQRSKLSEDTLRKCRKFLEEGYSYRAVAGMVHVDERTLFSHFPGMGFTRKQTVEAAIMGKKMSKI